MNWPLTFTLNALLYPTSTGWTRPVQPGGVELDLNPKRLDLCDNASQHVDPKVVQEEDGDDAGRGRRNVWHEGIVDPLSMMSSLNHAFG